MKDVEAVIKLLETLKNKWDNQASFLERIADKSYMDNEDLATVINMAQYRVIGECRNDLHHTIQEIKEVF